MLDLLETKCSVWFAIYCIAHICMTDMTSLISFFLILFHYWAAFVVFQQNWVNNTTWNYLPNIFSALLSDRGAEMPPPPLLKICHTYPKMIKLSTVIPYLTKIQNIYKSRDIPIKFCWHQYFFTKIGNLSYVKKYRYRLHFNT